MTLHWQTLNTLPRLPALYLRAAHRRKITGNTLPGIGVRCWIDIDPKRLSAYRQVCGFADNYPMPATYPHALASPLHMQLLTASDFPFPMFGLVMLANRIRILRPLGGVNRLRLSVFAQNLEPHPRGALFDLITQVDDALGPLWEAQSRMLCRGAAVPGVARRIDAPMVHASSGFCELGQWAVPSDIGRAFAKVAGDYNPIHLSTPSAKLFGFPRAIAHGMWLKARSLAALNERMPAANIDIAVTFKRPLVLPGEVVLSCSSEGSIGNFHLTSQTGHDHLRGSWRPNT